MMGLAEIDKPLLGTIANALTVLAYLPYMRSIFYGRTRPHVFSWIIWGLATGIAFMAVLQARGGAGAWPIGFSCLVSILVAGLAYFKRADITITPTDWWLFFAALAAIPVWVAANDPLWAVVLITLIELLGFGPTFRKTWFRPHSESMSFLLILIVRNTLIIAALGQHTFTTVLFPAAAALACVLLVAIMVIRRPQISP
jgi:hypothetical protein